MMRKETLMLLIIFSLVPLFWFRGDSLIIVGDEFIFLNPGNFIDYADNGWNSKFCFGQTGNDAYFLLAVFWKLFSFLPLFIVQRLWCILLYGGILFSFYLFLLKNKIVKEERSAVLGAVLYAYNPFTMLNPLNLAISAVQLNIPLFLIFFEMILKEEKMRKKIMYGMVYGALTLTALPLLANPPAAGAFAVIAIAYSAFMILSKVAVKEIAKTFAVMGVFALLFNALFIANFIAFAGNTYKGVGSLEFSPTMGSGKTMDFFRLLGFWAFRAEHMGERYYPYSNYYDSFPLLLLNLSIPVMALSAVAFAFKNEKKKALFFGTLALMGLFLAKGSLPPLGQAFNFLFKNIPMMKLIREPFTKFSQVSVFTFSALLAIFHDSLGKKRDFVFYLLLAVLVLNAFPIFLGTWTNERNIGTMRSMQVKVPDYYSDAIGYVERQKGERIFLFPKSHYGHSLVWEHGISTGGPSMLFLTKKEVIFGSDVYVSQGDNYLFMNELYNGIYLNRTRDVDKIMKFQNIDFVFLEKDVNSVYTDVWKPDENERFLDSQGFADKKGFGNVTVYGIRDALPRLYLVDKCYVAENVSPQSFFSFMESDAFSLDGAVCEKEVEGIANAQVYFKQLNESELRIGKQGEYDVYLKKGDEVVLNGKIFNSTCEKDFCKTGTLVLGKDAIRLDKSVELFVVEKMDRGSVQPLPFEKINPSEYKVNLEGKKGVLVFVESFNGDWEAEGGFRHVKLNGFMNGWIVDREESRIGLYFKSNRTSGYLLWISLVLIACTGGWLVWKRKSSR